jgi:tripartite-type tricarboxylate transporter receptor subunit TctC
VSETYPGLEVVTAYGLAAPSKTPRDLVLRINGEILRALGSRDVIDRLIAQGHDPFPGTPEDMRAYTQRESAKWSKFIKAAGIKAED